VHYESRGTYGSPRVHAELRLGLGVRIGRKRVARLMRAGVCHRRKRRGWRPAPATHVDLVQRRFVPQAPDTVWFTDITQHRAADGWVYCCAVIDGFSRRVVGWSIADHIRTELVVDALQMARWQREPVSTIVHADRGTRRRFNWSSQHLGFGGVYGQASGMDDGADGAGDDEVAGRAVASERGRAGVLAGDRQGAAA
jgi:transposase InsO family protein